MVWTIAKDYSGLMMEIYEVGALWKRFDIDIISPQEYQVKLF